MEDVVSGAPNKPESRDDFDQEVALVRQNAELMQLLTERLKEKATYSLKEVREKLQSE